MRRLFAKNLLFVVGVNLLVKPAWIFLIDREVQNRVGHAAYGSYVGVLYLAYIFGALLDLGINNYNSATVAQHPDRVRRLYPLLMGARMALGLVFALVVFITALLLPKYPASEYPLLAGVILIQITNMMLQGVRINAAALHRFRLDGILSVTDKLLMILLCGALLWLPATAHRFTIAWFVTAQIGCNVAGVLMGWWALHRRQGVPWSIGVQLPLIAKVVKRSLPFALLIFLMSIYMRADSVLLRNICGAEETGRYQNAFRMLDVSNMFAMMVAGVLLPVFSRLIATKESVAPIVRLIASLMLPVSFVVSVAAWFWGKEIMMLLYPAAGGYEGRVFSFLMLAFPGYCVQYIYSTLLTAGRHISLMTRITGGGALINLILNVLLIYSFREAGAMMAAIVAAVTMVLLSIAFIWFAHIKHDLPHNARWIASLMAFGLLCAAAGYGLSLTAVPFIYSLATLGIIGGLLMLVLRLMPLKSTLQLLKKR